MKIAVNTRLLIPDKLDGIGRFTYETIKRLILLRPNDQFTLIFDRPPPKEFSFGKNVSLITLNPQARHPILWFIWFEYSLRFFLNKNSFDLFISPEGWIPSGLKMKSLAVIHDLNFIHLPQHVKWSHRAYLNYFFPKYARRASRIATVSSYSKLDIAKTLNIQSDTIDVVYNGAVDRFKPSNQSNIEGVKQRFSNGKDYFIFIGTIHPRKNLNHLLMAFDLYKTKGGNCNLLIVGNKKWWTTDLEHIYQNLTKKDSVKFLGRQSDETLAQLLSGATALTYLPYFEGFGIPILEAMSCETPIIASNTTSMPEVAGKAALLSDPEDIEYISEHMLQIETNLDLRTQLIEEGKKQRQLFSWEKTTQLLNQSIEKTIG